MGRRPVETRDAATVDGFGFEWSTFDQSERSAAELRRTFDRYFAGFPWPSVVPGAVGLDLGCGSGRWARLAAERGGAVIGVDASRDALRVAAANVAGHRVLLVRAAAGALPLRPGALDFAYSLGVLHHTTDPLAGLRDAVESVRPGSPVLVYLYYALDGRPAWFRAVWRLSDVLRRGVSRLPHRARLAVADLVAVTVYLPLASVARLLERRGRNVDGLPLSAYRDKGLYAMRTDALDRFGTRVEKRYRRDEVVDLLAAAGLVDVTVADGPPYWCAVGRRPA